MEPEQTYNIQRLPRDIQIEYIKNLSPIDLLYLYETNTYYRDLLDDHDVLNRLATYYQINVQITLFDDLIISLLAKLSPKEIYDLYIQYPFIEPYLNNLQITIKFYPLIKHVFEIKRVFEIKSVLEFQNTVINIKFFEIVNYINAKYGDKTNYIMLIFDNIYRRPISFIDNNIITDDIILRDAIIVRRGRKAIGKSCTVLRKFDILYILEKLNYNPEFYINTDRNELCKLIFETLNAQ
jgi:hypothetical protein